MATDFVILMGLGKAGKSTYAKKLAGGGYHRIDIDKHFKYGQGIKAWYDLVRYIVKLLNDNPDTKYVLDGHINACTCLKTGRRVYSGHGFEFIQAQLRHHVVRGIVVLQSMTELKKRGSKETEERMKWLYAWFLTTRGSISSVIGSGENKTILARNEAMAYVLGQKEYITPTRVGSKLILQKLKHRKIVRAPHHGDPYYQTVELSDGLKVQGYNKNYEHKTWKKIKDHLNVRGKSVAEVGCHHGFYLLAMEELGAEKLHGYDFNPWTVESAYQIAHFRESIATYELFNIDDQDLPEMYDVILVMNALRHFKKSKQALRRIFTHAKDTVVFETQYDVDKLRCIAQLHEFAETHFMVGRDGPKPRKIIFFDRVK